MNDHILATGGSRGIGAAIVRLAAERGRRVTSTYVRDHGAARDLVQELSGSVHAINADASDLRAIPPVIEEAWGTFGPLTSSANNAGVTGRLGRFEETTDDEARSLLDTNVLATISYSRAAVKRWKADALPGVIVNLSSIAATTGALRGTGFRGSGGWEFIPSPYLPTKIPRKRLRNDTKRCLMLGLRGGPRTRIRS
ncbi:MAG: SDR family NAD(P)-dependent oxidoreductase [Lacisediminihabitans sp.]